MAEEGVLPASSTPPLARRELNTIMEESERGSWSSTETGADKGSYGEPRLMSISVSSRLSSSSDDYPTPRFYDFPDVPRGQIRTASSLSSHSQSSMWSNSDGRGSGGSLTSFEDLYDDSDDDRFKGRRGGGGGTRSKSKLSTEKPYPKSPTADRSMLPSLVIPGKEKEKEKTNFVVTSAASKVAMSPAVLSMLAQSGPAPSAAPSLDGSQTSEQLANSAAPSTPESEAASPDGGTWDGGVQLNPEALAILQALANDDGGSVPTSAVELPPGEMEQADRTERMDTVDTLTPCSGLSLAELTKLEIPSPSCFFASLATGANYTWCPSAVDPSSTTAEQFYKPPWDGLPNQRPRSVSPSGSLVRRIASRRSSADSAQLARITKGRTSPAFEYDEAYTDVLKETACLNLDRTSTWITLQEAQLQDIRDSTELPRPKIGSPATWPRTRSSSLDSGQSVVIKAVSFAGDTRIGLGQKETVFLKGCKYLLENSVLKDVFIQGGARYESVQTNRACAMRGHRNRLLGKYSSINKILKEDPDVSPTLAQKETAQAEKERHALEQLAPAAWNVMAIKTLNGGQLISAPAARRITKRTRTTESGKQTRARILDLGSSGVCDWAWFCAEEFPHSKVISASTRQTQQPEHEQIQGPSNHRQVTVDHLWELPFPDNHFDVISARSVYMLLKLDRSSGDNDRDEYDLCLRECMRCLRPGGYLEYSLLDSDLIGAGPLGAAKSVEFGFTLKTMGYDPTPTRPWLGRLRKAGFVDVKRSWMYLPVGSPTSPSALSPGFEMREPPPPASPPPRQASNEPVVGKTSLIANVTGLVGSLAWEKWMLKVQIEVGRNEENLLEGLCSVIYEGRNCGAGWRSLSGWARKPGRKAIRGS